MLFRKARRRSDELLQILRRYEEDFAFRFSKFPLEKYQKARQLYKKGNVDDMIAWQSLKPEYEKMLNDWIEERGNN